MEIGFVDKGVAILKQIHLELLEEVEAKGKETPEVCEHDHVDIWRKH